MYHLLMPILMHITILLLIIIPILCPHSNTSINAYSHFYTMLSYYYSVAYSLLSCHHSSTSIFSFLYNVVIPLLEYYYSVACSHSYTMSSGSYF